MSKKVDIAMLIAAVVFVIVFVQIVIVGHHYIMSVYWMTHDVMSTEYPHYYENYEAAIIAAIAGILAGFVAYFTMNMGEKIFGQKGTQRTKKINNSGMPQ